MDEQSAPGQAHELARLLRRVANRKLTPDQSADLDAVFARVVDAAMVRAVRGVTVNLELAPRDLALVSFGGAGPPQACAAAGALSVAASAASSHHQPVATASSATAPMTAWLNLGARESITVRSR